MNGTLYRFHPAASSFSGEFCAVVKKKECRLGKKTLYQDDEPVLRGIGTPASTLNGGNECRLRLCVAVAKEDASLSLY